MCENTEHRKEYMREYMKNYRKNNDAYREVCKERVARYYQDHKDDPEYRKRHRGKVDKVKDAERAKRYRESNRERINERRRAYYHARKNDPAYIAKRREYNKRSYLKKKAMREED